MSSILDALEKLEGRRTAGDAPEPPRRTRRRAAPLLAGAVLVAFATGIGITAAWLRPAPVAPAPLETKPPATVPAAPAPAPPATARAPEKPWGEVVEQPAARRFTTETIPATGLADRIPQASPGARRGGLPRDQQDDTAARERRPAVASMVPPPTVPPPAAVRPAGAPAARVSFLVYSSVAARRSVALTIGDAGLVTLHEGEATGGLSVVQILPDGVELDWQGQVYTIPARN